MSLRKNALQRSAFATRKMGAAMQIRVVGAWLAAKNVEADPFMQPVGDLTTPGCPGAATPAVG